MMSWTPGRAVLRGAVLLGAAVGCGGSDSGGTASADGGAWQPTAADQAFINDFCAAIVPCCESQGRSADGGACQQALRKAGVSHDSQLTSACLDEIRQRAATAACVPNLADLADPCARTFDEPSGPRAPGQSCSSNADCAGSAGTVTICNPAPTPSNLNAPPICVVRAVGTQGDQPCLATQFENGLILDYGVVLSGTNTPVSHGFLCQRQAGLYCDPSARDCAMLLPGGSPCTFADACASRVCQSDSTCRGFAAAGQDCRAAVCDGASYCDPATYVCTSKLADGAACVDSAQCPGSCEQGVCSAVTGAQGLVLATWCG
jgi:hypothetical protein